jgi:hypothetical protein
MKRAPFSPRATASRRPLRLAPLRANPGRFAHWPLFLEGLEKAGVPE